MEIRKKPFFQPSYYDYGKWRSPLNNHDRRTNNILRIINAILIFTIIVLVAFIINRGLYTQGFP